MDLAVKYGDAPTVEVLLKNGANVNMANKMRRTPLHQAVEDGNTLIVDLLFKEGASVHATNNIGDSPLHLAVLTANIRVIRQLLLYGSDVSYENFAGESSLTVAKAYHFQFKEEIMNLLLTARSTANTFTSKKVRPKVIVNFSNFFYNIVSIPYNDVQKSYRSEYKYLKKT